ncbi:MAG: hypothetical protein ACE5JZ_06870 [Kiloniellales bacterium]
MVRALAIALFAVLLGSAPASPHEAIDGQTMDRFLARITALEAAIAARDSVDAEAEAVYALGETLARITELLNRDLAMHGGRAGLVATVLVSELRGRGIDLSFSPAANRYQSHLEPFERYLALAPAGARRADALFRLLQGRFYDSFVSDPLQPLDMDWPGLMAQIEAAESFLARYPEHQHQEEATFILAVGYVRAFRAAPDGATAGLYRRRARAALTAFQDTYPGSLRAAAARALMQGLPTAD